MNYGEPDVHFDENRLPPGQNPIITDSMEKFQFFVELLMRSKRMTGYTTMGVVTGLAGVGKTIAIQTFLNSLEERPHTGLPAGIVIKVIPRSTTRAFLEDLLKGLGERPRSLHTNCYKIANEAAEAILDYDLKILFVDESDLLNVDGFEFLRYIFNKTGCPIVVVGLRRILRVIGGYEKFESRVGPHMPFQPPVEEEVLSTILPQLIFPHWEFNASSEADLVMGMELWNLTKPSFRNLRKVLQYASILAEIQEKERISRDILKLSYQMMIGQKHSEELLATEEEEEEAQTEFERESERRQDANDKKNEDEESA